MLVRARQIVRLFLAVIATVLVLVSGAACRKQVEPPASVASGDSSVAVPATGESRTGESRTPGGELAEEDGGILIPEGTPEELLDFMNELAARQPTGESPEEQDAELARAMRTRVTVADRIVGSQESPPWLRLVAVESKLESMRTLVILGNDSELDHGKAFEDLQAYAHALAEQEDADLAQLGRLSQFQLELDKLMARMSDEPSRLMSALDDVLQNEQPDRTVHRVVSSVADLLSQIGYAGEAATAAEKIYQKFGDHQEQELREASVSLYTGLMLHAAEQEEYAGNVAQARTMYAGVAEALREAPQAIADQINESLEPAQRRLALLGQPLELAGETLDGKRLNWSDYQGKVVLVDFWATWCGPCLAEIPNLMAAYEKFHERGFEVVGVNLDARLEDVTEFLEREPLPWVTIVGQEGQTGFDNPNAIHNGVVAIPFLALIGADGRVAVLHPRGAALEQEVSRLIADVQPEAVPDADQEPSPDQASDAAEPAEEAAEEAEAEAEAEEEEDDERGETAADADKGDEGDKGADAADKGADADAGADADGGADDGAGAEKDATRVTTRDAPA